MRCPTCDAPIRTFEREHVWLCARISIGLMPPTRHPLSIESLATLPETPTDPSTGRAFPPWRNKP